jgi:hypothetical protein
MIFVAGNLYVLCCVIIILFLSCKHIKSACYKFYYVQFADVLFTDQENAIPPPNTEIEVAEVPPINMIHYSSPLTSTDSASARTEHSRTEHSCAAAAPEEINSHRGQIISCGEVYIWTQTFA